MDTTEKIMQLFEKLSPDERKTVLKKFLKVTENKGNFNEYFTKVFKESPKFTVTPDNTSIQTPFFTATITIPGTKLSFTGTGRSKRMAKYKAGQSALEKKAEWIIEIAKT